MPRIGELLVAEGVLSEVAVQSALGFQRHTGEPFRLGTILLDRYLLGEESLMRALSVIHRCDYVAWSEILQAPPRVVRLLPERTAVRLGAIPYGLEGRGLRVAFKNPSNLAAVDEVSAVTSRPVIPAVISEVRLVQALNPSTAGADEFRNVLPAGATRNAASTARATRKPGSLRRRPSLCPKAAGRSRSRATIPHPGRGARAARSRARRGVRRAVRVVRCRRRSPTRRISAWLRLARLLSGGAARQMRKDAVRARYAKRRAEATTARRDGGRRAREVTSRQRPRRRGSSVPPQRATAREDADSLLEELSDFSGSPPDLGAGIRRG